MSGVGGRATEPSKQHKLGHSHKPQKLNLWNPKEMKRAIQEWSRKLAKAKGDRTKVNASEISRKWHIPKSTFYNRGSETKSSREVQGYLIKYGLK